MSIPERIWQFVLLTIITVGLYPLYFMVTTARERNVLLREIRDQLRATSPR